MSTRLTVPSIVVVVVVLLLLLPSEAHGAVRSGRVGQFASGSGRKSAGELRHSMLARIPPPPPPAYVPMFRRPGGAPRAGRVGADKSYACPQQDLTQRSLPSSGPATPLMEDRAVALLPPNDDDDGLPTDGTNLSTTTAKRYTIRLAETSPLSISLTASCTRKDQPAPPPLSWWVLQGERYVAAPSNGSSFFRVCTQRGLYQVVVNVTGLAADGGCSYRLAYNRKGAEEFRRWPFRNLTAPSRIKVQQQRRRYVALVKWEKSKLDIHAMRYCLAVSTGRRQRSLCQALGNSILRPACDSITVNDYLHRLVPRDERKLDAGTETTLVCTGTRTRQLIRGMKPNVTYYVDVFAVHSRHNNLSFLLGSSQVQLNRTRPTQLIEGKIVIGKLSTLGGLALFSFKVPKRSPNNFFKLHLTPCGGSVNVEILKRRHHVMEPILDVYYPRTITVGNVQPGDRYLIRVYEGDDSSRMNRIQVAVSSREDFLDLPRMPANTSVTELVPLRKCQSSTVAWFGSPQPDVTYCVYVFKLSRAQYYNNVKIPTYCELESREVCNHPQFHNKHCFSNGHDHNPLSLDIPNLQPEHYYSVFVTAVPPRGRSLPYKSVRIKTASYCPTDTNLIVARKGASAGKRRNLPGHGRTVARNSLTDTGGPVAKRASRRIPAAAAASAAESPKRPKV